MQNKKFQALTLKIISFLYISLFIITPVLVYHKTSELFEFNKILYIYLITGLVSSIWIYEMILNKKIILKKTILDPFILFFLVTQIASVVFSIDRHTSIFGYYGRFNGGLLPTFSYIILYYAFTSHIGTIFNREWVLKLLKVSLFVSFAVVLWGITGWIGYDGSCAVFTGVLNNRCWTESFKPALRMFSTLGQPNWLGAYLAANLSFCLYFLNRKLCRDKNISTHGGIIYLILILILFGGIFATKSRSAMFASSAVTLLFLTSLFLSTKQSIWEFTARYGRQIGLIFGASIIALVVFKTGIPAIDNIVRPFSSNRNITEAPKKNNTPKIFISRSSDIRRLVWDGAIKLGVSYPLFGTGVETFGYSYYFKRPAAHNLTSEWDYLYNRAHNEYLNYLATAGFTGLAAYLLFLGACVYLFIKQFKKTKSLLVVALGGGFVAILITNFFGFSTTTSSLFLYLIPAFQLAASTTEQKNSNDVSELSGLSKTAYILPVIIAVGTFSFVFSYFQADKYFNLGAQYLDGQDFSSSIQYLQRALTYKYEHVYEDKLAYALSQAALVAGVGGNDGKDVGSKLIKAAKQFNEKSIIASSKNILYYKTGSKVNFLAFQITSDGNDFEDSIDNLEKAENLAPTEPKIPYTKALFLSFYYDQTKDAQTKKKLAETALDDVDKAINLKKDYRDAFFLKAAIYAKTGDKNRARQNLEFILKNIEPNDLEAKAELKKL